MIIADVMKNMEVSAYPTSPKEQRCAEWWQIHNPVRTTGSNSYFQLTMIMITYAAGCKPGIWALMMFRKI